MAGLKFTLEADVKKLQELRKEIEKVTVAISKLPSDSPQIRKLETQLSQLRKEYDGIETLLSKVQLMCEELAKSENLIKHTRKQTDETKKATEHFEAEAGSLAALEKQAKSLTKEWLAMSEARKQSDVGQGKVNELAKVNAQIKIEKDNLRALQKEYVNTQKIQDLQEGSIKSLRAELSNLNAVYDSLGRSQRKGAYGKELLNGIQTVYKELVEAEQASGRFQRVVGNYASAFNGLGFSVQQVARELPSLAISANTFFLAISNNLPMLADEIKKASLQYKAFKAELSAGNKDVKAVAPVWQQLAKSIISWQTALVVGITLLSVYGKEVINWGKELVKGKNYVLDLLSAEQELALARRKGIDASAKERVELDLLYTKLKSTSVSQKERTAAANAWISRYPKYADVINGEKVNLDKLKLSYNALSKEIEQSAIARSYMDKVADIAVKKDKEDIKLKNQQVTLEKARQRLLKANEERNKALEAQQKGLYGSTNAVAKANDEIVAANKAFQEQKKIYNDISNNISKLDEQQATFINHINTISIFPQPKEGTYDYWQQQVEIADNALKQIQDSYLKVLKSGNTQGVPEEVAKQYNALIKQKTEAEEKLKIYDDKGLSKEYNSIVDQNQKISDLMDKQSIERKRREEDLENQAFQARINAMADGEAKIRAQRALDNKKEIQDLKRQREDYIRTEIEYQKKIFDERERLNSIQIKNYKKKTFDPSSVSVDTTEWDTIIGNTQQRQAVDWYKPLLKQYQSYADQRLAIEKQFNDDIALLRKAREKADKSGNTAEVSQIDRSIAKAISEKGKALMQHDFDILKKSPEYVRAFEDLKNTSSETLSSLLEQLEKAKGTAATILNPEDLREYTSTIQRIIDELDSRNPFQALADKQRELADAERELAEAEKELKAVQGGAQIVKGVKNIGYNANTGKIESTKTYLTATEALNRYNAAKDKTKKANNNFVKAEKTAIDKVNELASALKGIGEAIGGESGEIISFMGDVTMFVTSSIEGMTKVTQTGANAISTIEKASVILGIISAGIQLMQQLNSILPTADRQYEKYAEKVAEINKLTDAVNEYRIAALEAQQAESNWFSEDNLRNLRDYKKLHDEVAKAYKTKAEESQAIYQNKSGGGWFTNSWNWFLDNTYGKIWGIDFARKYKEGQTAAINNLRIETRKRSKGFLGSGIGGHSQETEDVQTWINNNKDKFEGLDTKLFDDEGLINKELAQSLINNYGDKLVGQTKETLEALLELREKYDEYTQQLHEYVSSLYEPLVNNFVDSIWAWFDEGKDALDSFKDYASDTFRDIVSDMLRTIVLDKVVGSFSDDIAKLYEEYASGKLDEEALMRKVAERTEGLIGNYEKNIPTLENILENVNGYLEKAGIDMKGAASSSQESSKKGFATASQDSIDELNGRFTALQIAGEEIKNQSTEQTRLLDSINSILLNMEQPQTAFSAPDLSFNNEILNSSAAASVAMKAESNAQLQAAIVNLTGEVQAIKNNVSEMLTFSAEDRINQQTIAENSSSLNKNIPKITQALDGIKQNTNGLSRR